MLSRFSGESFVDYQAPRVDSVSGCVDQGSRRIFQTIHIWLCLAGIDTTDCAGNNITLTVRGVGFGASGALVFVGATECVNVQHHASPALSHRQLTCKLVAGLLQSSVVVIQQRAVASAPSIAQ